jgi:hypothetical protein
MFLRVIQRGQRELEARYFPTFDFGTRFSPEFLSNSEDQQRFHDQLRTNIFAL